MAKLVDQNKSREWLPLYTLVDKKKIKRDIEVRFDYTIYVEVKQSMGWFMITDRKDFHILFDVPKPITC